MGDELEPIMRASLLQVLTRSLLSTRRLKLHPVMSNQDVCQVGTLLTLLDGSLKALTGAMIRKYSHTVGLSELCNNCSSVGVLPVNHMCGADVLIQMVLPQAMRHGQSATTKRCVAETVTAVHYERVFLYCLAWSVGGLLPQQERPAFDTQLRTLSSSLPQEVRSVCC